MTSRLAADLAVVRSIAAFAHAWLWCDVLQVSGLLDTGWAMRLAATGLALGLLTAASPALAWGDLGHELVALIAYKHLTPAARAKVDALLASDPDTLTAPDIASRATWADKYRNSHRETAAWHFVDIELDQPDLAVACFNSPASTPPASQGPAQDCVVDKIHEFAAELKDPATPPAERLMALKFVLHFVGDLHQPLHSADHSDKGGNCIALSPSPDGKVKNLHAFWDVTTVNALGSSAASIASKLDGKITPAETKAWSAGTPKTWARRTASPIIDVPRREGLGHRSQRRVLASHEGQTSGLTRARKATHIAPSKSASPLGGGIIPE